MLGRTFFNDDRIFALFFRIGYQDVSGRVAPCLRVARESGVGGDHFDSFAFADRVDRLFDLHDRAGALQSAGVDFQGFYPLPGMLRIRFAIRSDRRRFIFDRRGRRRIGFVSARQVFDTGKPVSRQNFQGQVSP